EPYKFLESCDEHFGSSHRWANYQRRRSAPGATRNQVSVLMEQLLKLALTALAITGLLHAEQHWWDREPLRIIDLTTSMSQIDYRDPARLAQEKADLGYNAEHLEVMSLPAGLDDRGFFFKSKESAVTHPDYLRSYIAEAKKRGIRV